MSILKSSRHWIAGLTAVAALLAGCGPQETVPDQQMVDAIPHEQRFGGTAVIAIANDPMTMNPLATLDLVTDAVHGHLLSIPLLRRDDRMEVVPGLVERWDTVRIAPDSLELTLHLRKDVRWHDGEPVTAGDVLFTYRSMRDPRVGFALGGTLRHWSPTATLTDTHEIRFRLRPYSDFLTGLPGGILPGHLLADVPPEQLRNHSFGTRPVGNGPFRFVRYVPGQEWVFEANPDFPAELGGRPYLDRLVLRIVSDQNARLTELLTGNVELTEIRAGQAASVAAAPRARLLTHPNYRYTFVAWNNRLPLFSDARVRRALSLALDRRQLLDAVGLGFAEAGRFTVTPGHWQFAEQHPESGVHRDIEAAGRLLDAAGWAGRDRDGIRVDSSGRPFRFTMLSPQGNMDAIELATIIQAQLRPLGVDVRPRVLETNTMWGQVEGHLDPAGVRVRNFEALVETWYDFGRKDDYYTLHSRSADQASGITGYASSRADELIEALSLTLDREAAAPLWREYERWMVDESPLTVLYYPHSLLGVHGRLQGVEVNSYGFLHSAPRWWIVPPGTRR